MNTPTIEELEAALNAALEERRQTDEQRRKAQSKAWEQLAADPTSWEWRATPYKPWCSSDPQNGLHIQCRVKPEVIEAWKAGGLPNFNVDAQNGNWIGMVYWRTDEGILTHSGGGHLVLRDPVLCSDAQWRDLEQGIVPVKWQRYANFA